MIDALSSWDVMALGSGNSLASSKNSTFSFSRRERAAFLLFSFMAQRADRPGGRVVKKKGPIKMSFGWKMQRDRW